MSVHRAGRPPARVHSENHARGLHLVGRSPWPDSADPTAPSTNPVMWQESRIVAAHGCSPLPTLWTQWTRWPSWSTLRQTRVRRPFWLRFAAPPLAVGLY